MHRLAGGVFGVAAAVLMAGGLAACTPQPQADTQASASAPPDTKSARAVPPKIRKDGVLTVGIDPTFPPMVFLDRGTPVGVDVDIIREIGVRLGLQVDLQEDAYALLVPGVAGGEFEAAISALTVDRNDLASAKMVTYYRGGSQLAVRPPAKPRFGIKNLCGRKMAVLDGSTQNADLVTRSADCTERRRKPIEILTYDAQAPATRAVIEGKAYGTYADSAVIQNAIAASNGALVVNGRVVNIQPYGIAVSKEPKDTLDEAIQGALLEMIKDGTYQEILAKWNVSDGGITQPLIVTSRGAPKD